jgi:type I restriction enzyme S subunit
VKSGWQRTTLGAAFQTVTGTTPPKNNSDLYGQFMPLVKPPELCDATLDSAEDGLSESGAEVARTLPPNSVLVSCIGNLGKVGLNTVLVAFNQQINAILPDDSKVIPEFMFYQVLSSSFKGQLEALASGTTVPIVNKSKFNSIEIVLPPLPEQQRIVGILDEAFDGIATAKANAEKNLQNARALFESYLQSVFTQRGEGWVEKRLDDACDLITCGVAARPQYVDVGVPFLSAKNVKGGKIVWSGYNCVSKRTHDELTKHNKPLMGDVLYTRVGSFGEAAVIEEEIEFSVFVSLTLIKPKKHLLNNYFLKYYLNSSEVKELAKRSINSSGVGNLNVGAVREFPIHVPTALPEQHQIVCKLDALSAETQRLESIYHQKLTALEALKKSLLDQAFTGNL